MTWDAQENSVQPSGTLPIDTGSWHRGEVREGFPGAATCRMSRSRDRRRGASRAEREHVQKQGKDREPEHSQRNWSVECKGQEGTGLTGSSQAGCVHPKSKREPRVAWRGQISPSGGSQGSCVSSYVPPAPRSGLPSIPGSTGMGNGPSAPQLLPGRGLSEVYFGVTICK